MGSLFFLEIMAKKKIQEYISEWMEPFGAENGYELSRTEFVKEGQTWFLRVYVDKIKDGQYDYMSSDDCEVISRYLSAKLDEADPISQNYYLEVSSPGLDRPLISDKDFQRFKGENIKVKLYEALNGKKEYIGILKDYIDGNIILETENEEPLTIPKANTSKVNLEPIF